MVTNGRTGATRWLALIGVALSLSCAAGSGGSGDDELLDDEGRDISLEVRNLNFYQAELFAVMGGARIRLGTVNGNSRETFSFRWIGHTDLRIEIRLLAVGTYFSDALPVEEGDDLELIIEPDLHRRTPARGR